MRSWAVRLAALAGRRIDADGDDDLHVRNLVRLRGWVMVPGRSAARLAMRGVEPLRAHCEG